MTTGEENKVIANRLAREVFSHGDMKTFDELLSDDYVNHNIPVPGIPGTKAGFRQLVEATRAAFPDIDVHVQDVVSEGDLVVFHDSVTATSKGDFLGVPPNGKRLTWTEIHFLRVAEKQIVEHWTNFDQLGILMQLDAIPTGRGATETASDRAELVVLATAKAIPGKEEALAQALSEVGGPTRAQPGCLQWELLRSAHDPAVLTAIERWASEEDHERHLRGAHVQTLLARFDGILAAQPEIVPMTPL